MRSEKSKKGSKNNKAKRNVQTVEKAPRRQSKEEIISEEELENRIAISGDIRLYLTMHLRIFIDGYFHHPKKKKLINLAQYIYDQKVLYIHKHGGYKLMELSSMGQVKYKAYLRRRFQPVGKQQEFLSKNSDGMLLS